MSQELEKSSSASTLLDVRNVTHFLQPIEALMLEGDRIEAEIDERLKDEQRRDELMNVQKYDDPKLRNAIFLKDAELSKAKQLVAEINKYKPATDVPSGVLATEFSHWMAGNWPATPFETWLFCVRRPQIEAKIETLQSEIAVMQRELAKIQSGWDQHREECSSFSKREEESLKTVPEFVENVKDMLATLPLRPSYLQEYRNEIQGIRLIEFGNAGTWKRAKRDMMILKTRLQQMAADIREKGTGEQPKAAAALPPAFDPDVPLTDEEKEFFNDAAAGTPFGRGF